LFFIFALTFPMWFAFFTTIGYLLFNISEINRILSPDPLLGLFYMVLTIILAPIMLAYFPQPYNYLLYLLWFGLIIIAAFIKEKREK
jgi:hypothetical protein